MDGYQSVHHYNKKVLFRDDISKDGQATTEAFNGYNLIQYDSVKLLFRKCDIAIE